MSREKSIACLGYNIAASSSSNNNNQEKATKIHVLTHDTASSSVMPQCKEGSLHYRIHSPTSMRRSGKTTFQCKFILLSQRHV
jgi:hypothetical protein